MKKLDILFFSVFISIIKIFFGEYSFGKSDLSAHLVPILRLMDESFIVNDFFANSTTGFGATFYFVRLMAYFGNILPLKFIFLIGTFLINVTIVLTTYSFLKRFFKTSNFAAFIISSIILTIDPFTVM